MNKYYRIDYAKSADKEICVAPFCHDLNAAWVSAAWTEPSGLARVLGTR
jgi:hypothetical protein